MIPKNQQVQPTVYGGSRELRGDSWDKWGVFDCVNHHSPDMIKFIKKFSVVPSNISDPPKDKFTLFKSNLTSIGCHIRGDLPIYNFIPPKTFENKFFLDNFVPQETSEEISMRIAESEITERVPYRPKDQKHIKSAYGDLCEVCEKNDYHFPKEDIYDEWDIRGGVHKKPKEKIEEESDKPDDKEDDIASESWEDSTESWEDLMEEIKEVEEGEKIEKSDDKDEKIITLKSEDFCLRTAKRGESLLCCKKFEGPQRNTGKNWCLSKRQYVCKVCKAGLKDSSDIMMYFLKNVETGRDSGKDMTNLRDFEEYQTDREQTTSIKDLEDLEKCSKTTKKPTERPERLERLEIVDAQSAQPSDYSNKIVASFDRGILTMRFPDSKQ